MESLKTIKPGWGYWETDNYPIGGCFRRAGENGVKIVAVLRTFPQYQGATEEGKTEDGRRVAYGRDAVTGGAA